MSGLDLPNFRVYAAVARQGGQEELLGIGLAYLHDDRKGLTVALHALPLGTKLVVREIEDSQFQVRHDKRLDVRQRPLLSLKQRIDAYERALIEQCLQDAGGRINTVMEWLCIPRRTLSDKMARFGISRRNCLDHNDTGSDDARALLASANHAHQQQLRTRHPRQQKPASGGSKHTKYE